MNRLLTVCAYAFLLVLASCKGRDSEIAEIKGMENRVDSMLSSNVPMNPEQLEYVQDLFSEYDAFVRNYPEDTMCPKYLFKYALICDYNKDYTTEVQKLDELATKYPESYYAPQALVAASKASIEYLDDKNAAVRYLQMIKEKYPESPYAVNIDLQIEYVGDDDGLLRAIWAKNGNPADSLEQR